MNPDLADRILLGWSHQYLAKISGVATASVYLLERTGSAGEQDDRCIRNALIKGKASQGRSTIMDIDKTGKRYINPLQHSSESRPDHGHRVLHSKPMST